MVRNEGRWLVVVILAGCGGDRTEMTSFGPGVSASSTDPADGSDDGDVDPDDGVDDETSAGSDAGSTGSGETGSDTAPEFECDIAIACHDGALVAGAGVASVVPIGCGGPGFTLAQSITVSNYADPEAPRSVPLLGDLDGDGDLDLAVNFRKAGAAYVFAGAGDGRVSEPPAASLDGGLFAGGWGGDLGDIDGDGDLDVMFGDHARGGRAWLSMGNMAFTEARTGLPDDVLFSGGGLSDVDGDGNVDALFGADQFGSGMHVYRGDGAGSWSSAAAPALQASNIGYFASADYDSDGDLDVFAFGKSGPGVTAFVFENDGGVLSLVAQVSGGMSPLGADPVQGSIGDVDCDGNLDIAAGGTIHLGDGATWTLAATLDASQISHLGDMNGDGHLDLVTHDPSVGLALWLGDGTGTGWSLDDASGLPDASDTSHGAAMDSAYGIDLGDLDGNEALDIVRVAGYGAQYYVDVFTR
jgi:hypothetical protein